MNDPGLDEPIEDANEAERQRGHEKDEKRENEQEFLEPRCVFIAFLAFAGDALDFCCYDHICEFCLCFDVLGFEGYESGLISGVSSRWWFASTAFPLIAGTFGYVVFQTTGN